MSLKTWLMPSIMQRLLSQDRVQKQRGAFEKKRVRRHESHVVHYFHQPVDPYSALLASVLPALQARYRINIETHIVSPPSDAAAPERAKLVAYSQRDAALLAAHYGMQPGKTLVRASSPSETRQAADELRAKLGHYLGAMLYYGGEWYWGIDRLYHLETRLQKLGLSVDTEGTDRAHCLFPPGTDLKEAVTLNNPPPIDFFFSFRSPYSAIVAPRIFELAQLTGAEVHLRFVLPMVMRGLPVPREKRLYIVRDTAREAHYRNIPFGRLNDPVGKPTERGLSLIPFAQAHGKGPAYVLSFMHGVWAPGHGRRS